jgi:hypothetical protein
MNELFSTKTPDEQKVEAKSKRAWLLLGVFGFGLSMFVARVVLDFHQDSTRARSDYYSFSGFAGRLAPWLAIGYFWGYWMWRHTKRNW